MVFLSIASTMFWLMFLFFHHWSFFFFFCWRTESQNLTMLSELISPFLVNISLTEVSYEVLSLIFSEFPQSGQLSGLWTSEIFVSSSFVATRNLGIFLWSLICLVQEPGCWKGDHTISVCAQSCTQQSAPHSEFLTWVDSASCVWQSNLPNVNSFPLLHWYVGSIFFNWINILHSRADYFLCGLAVAIWEQIQFPSADEESNICSWFPAAFLQTMHLDAQFEFLPKK